MRWRHLSAKMWLNFYHVFDTYVTYSLDGLHGVRRMLREFVELKPRKPKKKYYRPYIEPLETLALMNVAPVAVADVYSVHQGQTTLTPSPHILANDSDADWDMLSADLVSNVSHALSFNLYSTGEFDYEPEDEFVGEDSFTYRVYDGTTHGNTVTVTICVTNDDPVAVDDSFFTDQRSPLSYNVLTNDSDENFDMLTVSLVGPTTPHGYLSLSYDGSFNYTSDNGFAGIDKFSYKVWDGAGFSDVVTVYIHVNDIPPVATDDSPLSTYEDTPLAITAATLLYNDYDYGYDTLTLSAWTKPEHGSLAYNLATKTLTYTSDENFNGSDTFDYTINDGHGGTDIGTVGISVYSVNDDPVAKDDLGEAGEDIKVLKNDKDADGDTLTVYSVTNGANGTVSIGFDYETVAYVPTDPNYLGVDQFTYTVSDGNGGYDTATVTVTVGPGQWATHVIAVSSVWTSSGPFDWNAEHALGKPNTWEYGDLETAWAPDPINPDEDDDAEEFITLGFDEVAPAYGFLIRETYGNGFVTSVQFQRASNNAWYTVWSGTDPSSPGAPVNFWQTFTVTDFDVKAMRIYTDIDHDDDAWEEIDAVMILTVGTSAQTDFEPELDEDPAEYELDEDESVEIPFSELVDEDDDVALGRDWLYYEVSADPEHGYVEISGTGFTYYPDPDYNGSDNFEFTVTDIFGKAVSSTIDLTITPVADEPYLSPYYITAAKNASPFEIDLTDYIYDVDGESIVTQDSADATVDGLVIEFTPPTDFTGIYTFNYTVRNVSEQITIWITETGQWATSVTAESSYGSGEEDYSASQASLAPDVFGYGDSGNAWAAYEADDGLKTVTASFTAATPTGILIRESNAVGFVTRIEVHRVSNNTWIEMWSGSDPSSGQTLTDLILRFPSLGYTVDKVRVTVDTDHVEDEWEEIDAIALLTGGSPSTTTISGQPFNTRPVAADDIATAELNQTIPIYVLANDYDPNGDTITITAKTDGAYGDVTIVGSTVTFDPDTDWYGDDTFTYTISDGDKTTTATVHVTVYALGQWGSTVEYSSQAVNNSGDSSGFKALGAPDTLTYGSTANSWTPQFADMGVQTITVGIEVSDYASGVVIRETSGNGFVTKIELQEDTVGEDWITAWTGTDSSTQGSIVDFTQTFTLTTNKIKAIRVTVNTELYDGYEAIDAIRLLTDTEASPANTAPTATGDTLATDENVPSYFYAMENVTDGDGDPMLLSVETQPEHGWVEVNRAGTPNDTSDDFLIYHPADNFSGEDSFVYKITDSKGASDTATVDVTVAPANQAPDEDYDNAVDIDVNGSIVIDAIAEASDPDDDELEVTAVTQGLHGAVSITDGGATVTYEPDTDFVGTDLFTYTVSDGTMTTVIQVQVTVHPTGQWAYEVVATSNIDGKTNVLGVPDGNSWYAGNGQNEFITISLETPELITGITIRKGGTIMGVELIDDTPGTTMIWAETDTTSGDFILNFEETPENIVAIRVYVTPGTSIDSIQALTGGTATETEVSSNATDGYGTTVNTAYDEDARPTVVTTYVRGLVSEVKEYTYTEDYLSQIVTTDAVSGEITETFDADGNRTSLTDPKGNETTWVYATNTVTMTDPLNNSEVKTYDNKGRLVSILTRNGFLRTLEYDNKGRLETETWYDGPTDGDAVVETFEWVYNEAGLVESAANSAGTYEYEYNAAGQITHVDQPFGVSQDFAYDDYGRRISVSDSLGGSEVSAYGDDGNLIRRILTQGGEVLRIDQMFDPYGRVIMQVRYSDSAGTELVATSTYAYDGNGNLTQILHKDDSDVTIAVYDYTYDESGRMSSQTDTQAEIDSGTPWVRNYTYDDLGQLLGDGNDTYDYDEGGNRDTGYSYYRNYADTADTDQLESDGTWTYTYDAEGNMTKKSQGGYAETWVYGYDHANHLISAQKLNQDPDVCGTPVLQLEAEYKYDVYGNRVEKDVDIDGSALIHSAVVTRFAIDGWNTAKASPIGNENYDVFADLDYTNALMMRYMRGDAVDQLLARTDGSDTRWALNDHLGSVRDLIDNLGASVDSLRYDSFGNIDTGTELDAADRGRYTFTGREFDVETELQYNRARYYDAATGRWISQDPMGLDAGNSNLYRYVNNSSVNQIDPSGLQGLQLTRTIPPGLTPIKTPYGEWYPRQKNDHGDFKLRKVYVSDFYLWFKPNPQGIQGESLIFINLIKTSNAKTNALEYPDAINKERTTPTGWRIDRAVGQMRGWYGYDNPGDPVGILKGSAGAKIENAVFQDGPSWNKPNWKWEFQTYLVVFNKNNGGGKVIGGVSWGFTSDENLKLTSLKVSLTKDYESLKQAWEKWNAQAVNPNKDLRNHEDQWKLGPFEYP